MPAAAVPRHPGFGPLIEPRPGYDGQSRCSPDAKPGVLAFRNLVLASYPFTGAGSISRDCGIGGTSEHKEGRAWDWGVNAGVSRDRAAADELIGWLLEEDRYGNDAAMARRLGVMYLIWNKRIWSPYSGWRVYCVEKRGACRRPGSGDILHPHTDHVHFSFTWAGALKRTTYWHPDRSLVVSAASHPTGLGIWLLGGNGSVSDLGQVGFYGAKDEDYLEHPAVSMAATPTGAGYWLTTKAGRVFGFGDARSRGSVERKVAITAMAAHPRRVGYWLVSRKGDVFAFGSAQDFGSADGEAGEIVDIAATSTGRGYWLVSERGRVFAFGDAKRHGNAQTNSAVALVPSATGLGYRIATSGGGVHHLGDASARGQLDAAPDAPIVDLVATPTGRGYWLVGQRGRAFPFGDARRLSAD